MSLKQKTITGLAWSFIDNLANLGILFIAGVVLARILSPYDFGLIGMLTVFIAISQSIIDSGFSQALIRKTNCTEADYSTTFIFNIIVGFIVFLILFLTAPYISRFFEEPQLTKIIRILGSVIIINAFSIVQRTDLTKKMNFKLQAKISVIAATGSGIIAIIFALLDYGVWSLVVLQLSKQIIQLVFFWTWNYWHIRLTFSRESFRELFGFGSKLMLSGLIDTIYRNIYYLIIGKYFSAIELGYYTRADQFRNLPSQNITAVIQRVTYPVLSNLQADQPRLRLGYQKIIRSTMFLTFFLMLGMAAVAKPLVLSLIGEKWLPSVIYLQLLCFVGMFYPLHALNLNMLNVKGRSDLFLKLEIIKKTLAIPTIIIGIIWGIKLMIAGMFLNNIVAYYLNSYWSGKLIGYSFKQQIRDILPSFIMATSISFIIFTMGNILKFNSWIILFIQIITATVLMLTISEILRIKDYLLLKELVIEGISNYRRKRKGTSE